MKRKLFAIALIILMLTLILCACGNTGKVSVISINVVDSSMKTQYKLGEALDLSGGQLLLTMSDGSTSYVQIDETMLDKSKFNTKSTASKRTLRITYNNISCSFVYSVTANVLDDTIEEVYLENMPSEFLKGEKPDVENGVLKNGVLCIKLSSNNVQSFNVKEIWIKNFSTAKTGTFSATIEYKSDYGDISIDWKYTVLDLSSVISVTPSEKVAIYQGEDLTTLKAALKNVVFIVLYSDNTQGEYGFSQDTKISGFSSNEIGEKSCTLSFYDKEQRLVKFSYKYDVKKIYPIVNVTFDENYSEGSIVIETTKDGFVIQREAQRKGWEFKGWYLYDGTTLSSQVFDFNQIIEKDITLKARWLRSTYTVYFNNFGAQTGSITYTVDDERKLPDPDNVPGFTFEYYVDSNGNRIDYIPKGSTGNLYLTGIWTEHGFTISYKLNDDDNDIKATHENPETYSSQREYNFLPATRKGYIFKGWTLNNQPITSTLNQKGELTLLANWELEVYTVTMVNGENGRNIKTINYRTTDSDTIIDNYQNDAYIFEGWYLDNEYKTEYFKNASGAYYIPNKSTDSFTLYAKLTECYTIRLITNKSSTDGEQIITLTFVDSDTVIEIPTVTKFGMDFLCWRHQKSMKDFKPIDGKIVLNTSEIKQILVNTNSGHTFTLNALYKAKIHDITYVLYGEVRQSDSYSTDTTKTLITPTREGYTFVSWYSNENYSGSPIYNIEAESMDEDKVFYAKWKAINYTITVHYILDNVTKGNIPATYTAESETFRLEPPSKDRYIFEGWYSDPDYIIPQATTIFKGSFGDLEIYAKWSSETATISFQNMENASYSGDIKYAISGGLVILENAERAGYTFAGFYKNEYFTAKIVSFEGYDYPNGITIYAKWDIINYSIDYVMNDSKSFPATNDNVTSYNVTSYPALIAPSRKGYTFVGWYSAQEVNNVFDDRYKISSLNGYSENITLYASWKMTEFNISYIGLNTYGIDETDLAHTYTIEGYTLPALQVDYYIFKGWYEYDTEDKINSLGKDTMLKDIRLEPKLSAIEYQLKYSVNGHSGNAASLYTIEDFIDGVYTLPSLDKLTELNILDKNWYKGMQLVNWKSGSNIISITLDNTNKTKSTTTNVIAELQWITHSITYVLSGGTLKDNKPASFTLENPLVLQDATLEEKAFKGWADEDGNLLGVHSNGFTTITDIPDKDLILTAVFVDIYSITYENDDNMLLSKKIDSFSEAESQNLGSPTKTNSIFCGWWYKEGMITVTNTSELKGHATLIPMFYDNTATSGLTFKLNTTNNTASITGITTSKTTIILPSYVSDYPIISIESNAFANTSFTTIELSDNLQTIYSYAFSHSKLTNILIPSNVTLIQSYAFNECSNLVTLEIQGETVVESEAFKNNIRLSNITLAYIANVKENAFNGASGITRLTCDSSKSIINIFSKEKANSDLYYNASGYYIPSTLTEITIIGAVNNALTALKFTKLTLPSTTPVELTESVIELIIANNAEVYLPSDLLDNYINNDDYAQIASCFRTI